MTTLRVSSAAWLAHAIVNLVPGEFVYATGVSWAEYERLLLVRDGHRRGVRITYDRGRIELETAPSTTNIGLTGSSGWSTSWSKV